MKKNILTIIIMAIVLINTILTAVLIFAIVPTANRTNKLVTKVASIVDLELESPDTAAETVSVLDKVSYDMPAEITANLKNSTDGSSHYAVITASLSINSSHKDYKDLNPKIPDYKTAIEEIVQEEFAKYMKDEVNDNKAIIKEQILTRIKELLQSDLIIDIKLSMILS